MTRSCGARLVTLLREHCGTLSEKSVGVNVALVHELLGEMVVGQPGRWGSLWGWGDPVKLRGVAMGWGVFCGAVGIPRG